MLGVLWWAVAACFAGVVTCLLRWPVARAAATLSQSTGDTTRTGHSDGKTLASPCTADGQNVRGIASEGIDSKKQFLLRYGGRYGYNQELPKLLSGHFTRLARSDTVYLDYAGSALYSERQLRNVFEELQAEVVGNPHSAVNGMGAAAERERQLRAATLAMCNASPNDYDVVFTSGATAALKLVGESFPWGPASRFAYTLSNHTSVLGIREYALAAGGTAQCLHVLQSQSGAPEVHCVSSPMTREGVVGRAQAGPCWSLFACPLECNFSGDRSPEALVNQVQKDGIACLEPPGARRWMVVLDAAKAMATHPPDLAAHPADFVVLSYYKIFGYPTGLGALLVRKAAARQLRRSFFGGGTVEMAVPSEDHVVRRPGHAGWEHGTSNFLAVAAARHGFAFLEELGGLAAVRRHAGALADWLAGELRGLRHGNGRPVCELYGWALQEATRQEHGPTVSFNVRRADGSWVGFQEVNRFADMHGIVLRVGCFCNPGACARFLALTPADLRRHHGGGHVCSDGHDIMDGRPIGAIRASLGFASSFEDVSALVQLLRRYFVEAMDNQVQGCARTELPGTHATGVLDPTSSCARTEIPDTASDTASTSLPLAPPSPSMSSVDVMEGDYSSTTACSCSSPTCSRSKGDLACEPLPPPTPVCSEDTPWSPARMHRLHAALAAVQAAEAEVPTMPVAVRHLAASRDRSASMVHAAAATPSALQPRPQPPQPQPPRPRPEPPQEQIQPQLCAEAPQAGEQLQCPGSPHDHMASTSAPSQHFTSMAAQDEGSAPPPATSAATAAAAVSATSVAGTAPPAMQPLVRATLQHIFVYPIKSCAAMAVDAWPVGPNGLLLDREWALFDEGGQAVTQKTCPRMALIRPELDLCSGLMSVTAPNMQQALLLRFRDVCDVCGRDERCDRTGQQLGGDSSGGVMGGVSSSNAGSADGRSLPCRSCNRSSETVDATLHSPARACAASRDDEQITGLPGHVAFSVVQHSSQLCKDACTATCHSKLMQQDRAGAVVDTACGDQARVPHADHDHAVNMMPSRDFERAKTSLRLQLAEGAMQEVRVCGQRACATVMGSASGDDSCGAVAAWFTRALRMPCRLVRQQHGARTARSHSAQHRQHPGVARHVGTAQHTQHSGLGQYSGTVFANPLQQTSEAANLGLRHLGTEPGERYREPGLGFANDGQFLLMNAASVRDLNCRMLAAASDAVQDVAAAGIQQNGSSAATVQLQYSPAASLHQFRPNLVVDSCPPYEEDSWTCLQVGGLSLHAVGPCARCEMVLVDPLKGQRGSALALRTLASYRKARGKINFGVFLVVDCQQPCVGSDSCGQSAYCTSQDVGVEWMEQQYGRVLRVGDAVMAR